MKNHLNLRRKKASFKAYAIFHFFLYFWSKSAMRNTVTKYFFRLMPFSVGNGWQIENQSLSSFVTQVSQFLLEKGFLRPNENNKIWKFLFYKFKIWNPNNGHVWCLCHRLICFTDFPLPMIILVVWYIKFLAICIVRWSMLQCYIQLDTGNRKCYNQLFKPSYWLT